MVLKTLPDPSIKVTSTNQFMSIGQRRSQSATYPSKNRTQVPLQHRLPDADDLRRVCVITKSDLNRIYDNVDRRQRERAAIQQEIDQKNERAIRSAQIARQWPNTIAGMRERKLEMRKLREQQEEQRRKDIDIEEEKLAAERRREQIEKAKQLKYYETNRIRTFHSALLMTEVLKERDLQIEMKKRIAQAHQADQEEESQRYREAQTNLNKNQQEKLERRAKERSDLAQYQLAQIERKRMLQEDEKTKDRLEGEEYRRLAEQCTLEHMELEKYRKMTQKDIKLMYDKTLEDKFRAKQMEQRMEEEDDEELRIYAEAKKKIARIRREKEIQANQEKQETRDHMIGYIGSLQKRAEADLDSQMLRAQAEREAKELREEQEKLDKQKKMKESITKHRQETIKRREAEKQIEIRENEIIKQKKAETDELYLLYQKEKDKKRTQDSRALSDFLLKQTAERKDREYNLKLQEIDEVELDKHMNNVEKQQYQDYAGRVINYMEENQRNTYPMRKVYAEEMKRFEQWDHGSNPTTNHIQEKPSLNDTKKNLGFQWDILNK